MIYRNQVMVPINHDPIRPAGTLNGAFGTFRESAQAGAVIGARAECPEILFKQVFLRLASY
jgi:hypothetical protein